MTDKRRIEVFSAGCAVCEEAIAKVNEIACPSCEVTVLDMTDPAVAERAKALGIQSVPAVAINGDGPPQRTPNEACEGTPRAAGVGQSP